MFAAIMTLITGIFLVLSSLVLQTRNRQSLILFRLIPAILGIFCVLQGLGLLGVLKLSW